MTTNDKPPFDPVAAAAECMQWPTIAEAVRNYRNNDGFAETVFKLVHDDYTVSQAWQIVDVLLKRGKYAEATTNSTTPHDPDSDNRILGTLDGQVVTGQDWKDAAERLRKQKADSKARMQPNDLSRFIMYDAPIEIERAPDDEPICAECGEEIPFFDGLLHDGKTYHARCTPAAPVIPQPLSDLEVLTASIRRIKRTLETTPPLPDQVGILIEIIDTAYAECLNALDTLGVQS